MSNIWLTSDTHFGHENIISFCKRPFANVPEMNEALLTYWNETVKDEDTVYHLGDVAMGHFTDSWEFVKKLNGKLVLVLGNHDRISKRYHMSDKYVMKHSAQYMHRFYHIDYESYIGEWKLHHFPYVGDHVKEERFKEYRPVPSGEVVLIHGHVHEEWKDRIVEGYPPMLNVGVDVWNFRPVNLDTIVGEASRLLTS